MTRRAIVMASLMAASVGLVAQTRTSPDVLLKEAIQLEQVDGDLRGAVAAYRRIADDFASQGSVAAQALLRLANGQRRLGDAAAERQALERIVSRYGAEAVAREARTRLTAGAPAQGRQERRQIAYPDAAEVFGQVSPDGRWLTFQDRVGVEGRSASGNLGVLDLRSGRTELVTKAPCCEWSEGAAASSEIWSPDGQQIAYVWQANVPSPPGDKQPSIRVDLRVITRDGRGERVLFSGPRVPRGQVGGEAINAIVPMAWSPGRTAILAVFGTFVAAGNVGHTRLVQVSVRDGGVTTLKELGAGIPEHASYSPDGRFIIYDHFTGPDAGRNVFIMKADGSGHAPLAAHPAGTDTALGWTPDGGHVLFTSDRSGTIDVLMMPVANGKAAGDPVVIRRNVSFTTPIGLGRDGTLFTRVIVGLTNIFLAPIDPVSGKITAAPTPLPRAQTGTTRGAPTWSPDGKRIAHFQSGRIPSVVVQDVGNGNTRVYPANLRNLERIEWRPDGKAVAFNASTPNGPEGLFLLDLETEQLSSLGPGIQKAFSPDGRYLYRGVDRPSGLFRRDLVTGVDEVFYEARGFHIAFALSPDGRQMAHFQTERPDGGPIRSIWLLDTETRRPRPLLENFPTRGDGRLRNMLTWSRDGRYLFYVTVSPSRVWRVPVDGGPAVETGIVDDYAIGRINAGPDGRLAFSVLKNSIEIWAEPISALVAGRER
jgi:Tol biopolymer transport system component